MSKYCTYFKTRVCKISKRVLYNFEYLVGFIFIHWSYSLLLQSYIYHCTELEMIFFIFFFLLC